MRIIPKLIGICILLIIIVGTIFFFNPTLLNKGSIYDMDHSITANSGKAVDIQAAIDQLAANFGTGVVYVPAGVFNFIEVGEAWTTVNVPSGISIIGAAPSGSDSSGIPTSWNTVLVMPYDVPGSHDFKPVWFKLGTPDANAYYNGWSDKPTRFANIKLQGYRSIDPLSETLHKGIEIYGILNYRIDHCCIENCAGGGIDVPLYYQQNLYCSGVIDHSRIYNTAGKNALAYYLDGNVGYGVCVGRAYHSTPSGGAIPYDSDENILGKYTNYTHFIENCFFSKWRHCVASGHGGYYVFRYNTINGDFMGTYSLDVHGLRDTESGRAGGRGAEIYENTLINATYRGTDDSSAQNRGIFQTGGGSGVFFNNYIDSTYRNIVFYAEDYVASDTWHLKNSYFWAAKGTLTPTIGQPVGIIDASRNVVVDWARSAANPSDANYPNVDSSWSIAGYKPYTYPHPLTLGQEPIITPTTTATPISTSLPTLTPTPSSSVTPIPSPSQSNLPENSEQDGFLEAVTNIINWIVEQFWGLFEW